LFDKGDFVQIGSKGFFVTQFGPPFENFRMGPVLGMDAAIPTENKNFDRFILL
jgi:hypothetical protein